MDELSEDDKLTVARARKVQKFMSQPFTVAEGKQDARSSPQQAPLVAPFTHTAQSLTTTLASLAVFTGTKGEFVSLPDTIKGFSEIIAGDHDDIPEGACKSPCAL